MFAGIVQRPVASGSKQEAVSIDIIVNGYP